MKTIFVTLPVGLSVRNILYTGVLDRIVSRGDVRVIVFSSVPDLANRYPDRNDRLIFEVLPPRRRRTLTGLLNYVLNLRYNYLNDDPALTSIKEKRKGVRLSSPWQYLVETLLCQPSPRSKLIYNWLSALHQRRSALSTAVRSAFDTYQPSLLFATYPTGMNEFDFLKHAKERAIPTAGLIHSWDVLTTEGRIVVPLDYYLVWNRVMQKELINIHGISEDLIGITGIPQFDIYADPVSENERDKFLSQHGLDPQKSTVLFATSPGGNAPEEPEVLSRLVSAINRECPGKVQFLARIHPQDNVNRYTFIKDTNVRYQVPGVQMKQLVDWRLLNHQDLVSLRETLAYSDVVVNIASTISLDAIALDKPVVNVAFDFQTRDYYQSAQRWFNQVHFRPVVESGATKVAKSLDELVALTRRYLAKPELEQEQRTSLAEAMCHRVDGKSADRIASFLLETLDGKTARTEGVAVAQSR